DISWRTDGPLKLKPASCLRSKGWGVGLCPTYFSGSSYLEADNPDGDWDQQHLLTPARGFRSSRHTCRKPLLFDPAQSACYQQGGGPLLPPAPGVVCFRLAFSLMFPDWS